MAFNHVLDLTIYEVLITNNVSSRNSGGPLIDNEGKVVGMVSWGINDDEGQYNGAKMLDVFCVKILKCEYEYDGEKTWFDYGD